MAYCTLEDIQDRVPDHDLISLTDDTGADAVDTALVARVIGEADATVDAYCSGRYGAPLNPVPEKIVQVAADLAAYALYSRKAMDEAPTVRKDAHKEALRFLEMVAKGNVSLGSGGPAAQDTPHAVEFSGPDRVFSRDTMKGF